MHISQNDIKDLDASVDSDGKQRVYVGRDRDGVWESSFYLDQTTPPETWMVTGDNGVRDIEKYMVGNVNVVYVATAGGVFEYWWLPGSRTVKGDIITQQADIHTIDRDVTADGAQAVYTGANTRIYETYWWPGVTNPKTEPVE